MRFDWIEIEHVQLAAPSGCEEEARSFYGELLGLSEIPKPEKLRKRGGVWFQCGSQQIHIGIEDGFRPAKKAHPAFLIQDIAILREHLLAHGITIQDDDSIADVTRFFAEDPFGNRLEFMERKG